MRATDPHDARAPLAHRKAPVTDSTSWQPPSDPGDTSGAPAPFAPPQSGVPSAAPGPFASPTTPAGAPPATPFGGPAGAPPTFPGHAPGWVPPPKPGLIPLRPLTLGAMLGASFQVLRRNPRPMFGFALLLTGVVYLSTLVIVGLVTVGAINRIDSATGTDADIVAAGSVATIILSALIPVVLSLVTSAILQGIVSLEVARGTVGEKLRLGGLWRAARGRIGALIGWTLLVTAIVAVVLLVVILLLVALGAFGGVAGTIAAVLLGILLFIGLIVASIWLSTKLSLVPSALMIERMPLRAAIARSWSLTNGFFWRTFGILILVAVIINTASSVITTPLQLIVGLGAGLLNPNGDVDAAAAAGIVITLLVVLVTVVFGAIAAVVQSATAALIYIDLRMRKEGLDLELARFVEARQSGATDVPDPYRHRFAPAAV